MAFEGLRQYLPSRSNTANFLQGAAPLASAFGPWGAAAGLGAYALGNLIRPQQGQSPMEQAQQQLLQQLQQPQQGGQFAPIRENAIRQFQQNIVPGIAERFTGIGGQRSSAFGQQLGAAGADLASQLAGQEAEFGLRGAGLDQNRLTQLMDFLLGQQQFGLHQQGTQQQGLIGLANLMAQFRDARQRQFEQAGQTPTETQQTIVS